MRKMQCRMLNIICLLAMNSDLLVESISNCAVEEVPENFTVTPVTICPTGKYRKEKEKNCTNSLEVFHCLPDLQGNLYEFCGRSRHDLRYPYFVFDRTSKLYFSNLVFPISSGTETEFYSNFSQLILKEDPKLNGLTVFQKLREEVNNNSAVSCIDDLKEHFLPSRETCKVVSACVRPRHVQWIFVYIVEVRGDIGNIIIKCFPMPLTNTLKYALVALTLCRDNHSTLIKQCSTLRGNQEDAQEGNKTDCQEGNKTDCQEGNKTDCQEGNKTDCQEGIKTDCEEGNKKDCKEENTISLTIGGIFTCLIVIVAVSMVVENNCHLIDKIRSLFCTIIENRQQAENHTKGTYGQPTDANECDQQSHMVCMETGQSPSSQI
ncbi:uncharacterized protein LOC134685269 [Mytilus trossulus]|uniref:uncharacterized protein LOC134685269 n=1 Tax=Mytilus trossulus TaxID=6551 RepID=UPI003006B430